MLAIVRPYRSSIVWSGCLSELVEFSSCQLSEVSSAVTHSKYRAPLLLNTIPVLNLKLRKLLGWTGPQHASIDDRTTTA